MEVDLEQLMRTIGILTVERDYWRDRCKEIEKKLQEKEEDD